jgi:hypothetical protein
MKNAIFRVRAQIEIVPLDFCRRFLAGEEARAVKSSPDFIAMRERVQDRLLDLVGDEERHLPRAGPDRQDQLLHLLAGEGPRPGRIAEIVPLDFCRRFLAGEEARAVKSSPDFILHRPGFLAGEEAAAEIERDDLGDAARPRGHDHQLHGGTGGEPARTDPGSGRADTARGAAA